MGGCSGDSEELKTLKTLTAVSGHARARENKWKVLFSCCQKFDILLCMWFSPTISLFFFPQFPQCFPVSPAISVLFLSSFIVGLIVRSLVALTLVKIFAWACGKRRMIDDIAKGNSNQLAHFLQSLASLASFIKYTTRVQGNLKEKLEIMLPEIKENALALTSHHLHLSTSPQQSALSCLEAKAKWTLRQ